MKRSPAIVMNMFYTGLGIARSLGERGVAVIGLTSQRGVSGNFTRYARVTSAPDSRTEPDELLAWLLRPGSTIPEGSVIFPTRDDDVVFLDRFRGELEKRFTLTIPESAVVDDCLDKWKTYQAARRAGVPVPHSWLVETESELRQIGEEVRFPCVLKPPASHRWHNGGNWRLVGGRKAICIGSRDELFAEYKLVARADKRALVQEMVPGGDECLVIAACYFDRHSHFVAGFNTQKALQIPEFLGTGCIVRSAGYAELFAPTIRLLQQMRFTGIAEVEYKWDAAEGVHKLIEINPRPWDQHRLGQSQGVDLIWLAYCEHAGLPQPGFQRKHEETKWIAEDAFLLGAARSLYHRDGKFRSLFQMAQGKRVFAIWSWKDPLPFIGYMTTRFIPELIWAGIRAVGVKLFRGAKRATRTQEVGQTYETHLERGESHG